MSCDTFRDFIVQTATQFEIPGIASGIFADGRESFACHGVTSVENQLAVTQETLFILGSVTKTYTASAIMRLVADGIVELNAPVRRYLPELELPDEPAVAQITVLNLLNHTSGLDWGIIADTGEGDDALACYVAKLKDLKSVGRPGERASYSQAGYNVLGRLLEKVTGLTFEQAISKLLLEPLNLSHTFFARDDIMTRRFCVGHNRGHDGNLTIARLWRRARGDNPGGGLASSVSDVLAWARFHLAELPIMKEQTAVLRGSNLGDAIGIGWFIRDISGIRTFGHAGSANGQFADLLIVPSQNFAVVAMSNAGPNGIPANQTIVRWALQTHLGLRDDDPTPLPYDEASAAGLIGRYENDVMTLDIESDGTTLRLMTRIKAAIRAAADKELPPDHEAFEFALLPNRSDEYIIIGGAFRGQRGFFTRNEAGNVVGVDLAGRLFRRVPATPHNSA